MADCANHAGTPAIEPCAGCGRPLCERCLLPFAGLVWCEPCKGGPRFADAVEGRLRPPPPPRPSMPLGTRIFFAGLVGTLLATCVASAWFGTRALKTASGKMQASLAPEVRKGCLRDIEKIGSAARAYQRKHGTLPTRGPGESTGDVIRRLAADGYLQPADVPPFIPHAGCPGVMLRGYLPIAGTNSGAWIEDASYEGLGGGASLPYTGPIAPLAWDRDLENHGGSGRHVLFENGTVRWIAEGEVPTAIDPETGVVAPRTESFQDVIDRHAEERALERKRAAAATPTAAPEPAAGTR